MSENKELSPEAKAFCEATADCFRASGKEICYPNGQPTFDDPDLIPDPETSCVGPKPGCPCDRNKTL